MNPINPIRDLTLEANELMDKADQLGEAMTDLEITKLCAEAMGFHAEYCYGEEVTYLLVWVGDDSGKTYNPLHDDAQAMALVKKFKVRLAYLEIREGEVVEAAISMNNEVPYSFARSTDLNRAICECVAKMEKAKHG